ncbi:ATPase [Aureococcus anophagefferens]|nr:ATPase [Aureococcus anophagefferens]
MPEHDAAVDGARAEAAALGRCYAIFAAWTGLAFHACFVGVMARGAALVELGDLSAGDLSSFLMYAVGLGFAVAGGMASYAELARCAGAVERVLEISDRSPAMRGGNARAPSAAGATVSFRDVDFAYPARRDAPLLAAWSADVAAGERVALVFRLLSRLYDVDKGEVAVGGVGVAAYALDELRGSVVGVLQQEPFVFSGSLLENVACGGDCDAARAEAALRSAGLGGLLEKVGGVGAPVGESGVALSGGERQRLALAARS